MDLLSLERLYLMTKKEDKLKKIHGHKIYEGSDGRWRTYVYTGSKRKMLVKPTKEALIEILCEFYNAKDSMNFNDIFEEYLKYKAALVTDNTIAKYEWGYERYFKGTEFEMMDLHEITTEDVTLFLVDRIRTFNLRKRSYEELFGYLKGCLQYARNKRYIDENPAEFMMRKDLYRYCEKQSYKPGERIVSRKEMRLIQSKIDEKHEKKPNYIVSYAVRLASLTGMRVGEISALRWDHVDFEEGVILIDQAETFNQKTKEYSITTTKNDQVRYIPITNEIKKLLDEVRSVEEKYGYLGEYVFSNEHGQIHKVAIGRCATNTSSQAGIDTPKSIHAYRRTINSRLKENGVSTMVASSMLGHTEEVNEKNYTYDVTDMNKKREALEAAYK